MNQSYFAPDASEFKADNPLHRPLTVEELAENSVWDEPARAVGLAGELDPQQITWFRYYLHQQSQTQPGIPWLVTMAILVLAGPLAILGALFNWFGGNAWLAIVVMGPTVEEVFKIALPLWVIEKRPWLFSSGIQILICCFGAGLMFAAIENLLYLNVYIPNPSERLVFWRWTVCVALHTGCSLVAGVGLLQVRSRMLKRERQPQLIDGSNWIIAAIVIHGTYNAFAILIDGWLR
ncbi:MAG: PrsW family intramembrane metalloprotease [Pirellulaceae bacterium]|nr:PrsW family intramembrane metalloprotease [Pirellulaceae bacterium]